MVSRYVGKEVMSELFKYHRSRPDVYGAYDSLNKFAIEPKPAFRDDLLKRAALLTLMAFHPPELLKPKSITDIRPYDFPTTTNPGYPYVQLGLKTKIDAFPLAMERAQAQAKRLSEGLPVKAPPNMVFLKGAVCPLNKPKTRLIFGVPLDRLILQQVFASPLRKFQSRGGTPAGYHITPFGGGYRKMSESTLHKDGMQYVQTDFSAYDTSCPPWFNRLAYKLAYSYFDTSEDPAFYDSLWKHITDWNINKLIYMPDGQVFLTEMGDETGSMIFQLIQNMKTHLLIVYALLAQGYQMEDLQCIFVLGDDCSFSLSNSRRLSLEKLAETVDRQFGFKINADKSKLSTHSGDWGFLGRNLNGIQSSRDLVDIILALIYPRVPDRSPFDLAMRVVALAYENSASNAKAHKFLKDVWLSLPWWVRLFHRFYKHPFAWKYKWIKLFKTLGLHQAPVLRFPTVMQITGLVYSGKMGDDNTEDVDGTVVRHMNKQEMFDKYRNFVLNYESMDVNDKGASHELFVDLRELLYQ